MKLLKILLILTLISCTKEVIIEVDVAPQLEIIVVNSDGDIQNNASVGLYKNEEDFYNTSNAVNSGYTNSNGSVVFKELNESVYYFYAEKGGLNNFYEEVTFSNPLKVNEKRQIRCTIR